jgi:subtilase family serine protease
MSKVNRWLSLLGLLAAMGMNPASGEVLKTLHGHVPAVVNHLNPVGRVAATNQLRLAIGVPLRDPSGLDQLLAQLYDPASPNYRQFLTPAELAARFGPTEQDYEAVKQFAHTNGLAVATTYNNRLVLDVIGPAAAVEKALHITLHTYQHPTEARLFFAPDTEPTVAADLPVADIQGLSDFSRPHPRFKKMDVTKILSKNGSAPDGSGSYFGNDFRNAYASGTTLTGAGQEVGLLQFDGFYSNDIAAYAASAGGGRANIPIQTVLLDGYDGVPTTGANSGNTEVSLDIEQAMAMAPGLARIVVFEGGPNGSPNDILNSMLSFSNTVKQLSSSWGWSEGPSTTTDAIFKNMSGAGQSFFNASGDSDAFTTGASSANGVDNPSLDNAPSSSPYITQVGGTTLTMNGTGSSYSSETVWNWGVEYGSLYDGEGSSGGISSYYSMPNYSMPSWQTNVSNMAGRGGSASARNIPDVALTADNVYVVSGGTAGGGEVGGTSCAAPLWAGFMALVNQQAAAIGRPSAGFINPAIYAIAAGTNYSTCFNDVTTGNNTWSGSTSLFNATTGYDLCTGLGTPNGVGLINALAGPADALGISPMAGYAFSGPYGGPFNPSSGAFQLTNSSAAVLNWSLINTSAWLKADFTNGTLAAHATVGFNLSLTATASNLALGSYSATVAFTNLVSHVIQRFPITLQVYQPLSVSPVEGFTAVGPVGGPFTSGSQTLVLENLGNSAVSWSLINTSAWLTASANKGILAAGGNTSVTAALASSAGALAAAVYNASLVFTNSLGLVAVVPFTLSIGQPVIQNGGFETGDFTDWTLSGNTSSVLVGGNLYTAYIHSGNYAALLGPPYSPGYLTQNLTTSAGQTYMLSLWLRNPTGLTPNLFQVQWNGATIFSQTDITGTGWNNLQFLVTATNSITALQFGFQNDPDYFGLDDVNVTPLAPFAFKSTLRSAGNFQLAWNTSTGLVYQVQYKTNLLQSNWSNLGNATTATTTTLTITDTNAFHLSPQRFYRLQVVP